MPYIASGASGSVIDAMQSVLALLGSAVVSSLKQVVQATKVVNDCNFQEFFKRTLIKALRTLGCSLLLSTC